MSNQYKFPCSLLSYTLVTRKAIQKNFTQPFVTQKADQYTIAFVVKEASQQAVSEADIIVALGHPKEPEHIDIVILPEELETVESETKTV